MSDETIGSAIQRLTQERAQARLDLRRADTLIQELGECFSSLGSALNPATNNGASAEWAVSRVDAELAIYLSIDKLKGLLKNRSDLQALIANCTSKINGYTGE